jgi:hypothetical protein
VSGPSAGAKKLKPPLCASPRSDALTEKVRGPRCTFAALAAETSTEPSKRSDRVEKAHVRSFPPPLIRVQLRYGRYSRPYP